MKPTRTAFVTFSWASETFFFPQALCAKKDAVPSCPLQREKRRAFNCLRFYFIQVGEMSATGQGRLKRKNSLRPLSLRHDFPGVAVAFRFGNLQSAQGLVNRPSRLFHQALNETSH